MTTREAELHIRVMDGSGAERAPSGTDKVTVDGAALSFDAAKGFVHKLSGKKDIELVIAYAGFAELRQHFETEAPAERPKLKAFWPGTDEDSSSTKNLRDAIAAGKKRAGYLLECMSLLRVAGGDADARSPSIFTLTVVLHDTRELVAVIGTDYWEGAGSPTAHRASLDFDKYAATYFLHLRQRGRLDPSSPVTVLDCQRGVVERWMLCKGKGYRRQFPLVTKDPAPKWPTQASFLAWNAGVSDGSVDVTKLVGILDVYKYLSDTGRDLLGTVIDFSVFSHAWIQGPILFNTDRLSGSGDPAHHPRDLDARYFDFLSMNAARWPTLKDAFATDAEVHIWGCFATKLYREMIAYLAHGGPATFKKKLDGTAGETPRADVVAHVNLRIDRGCYMKQIAKHASVKAFGGPPGFGSDVLPYSSLSRLPARFRNAIGTRSVMVLKSMLVRGPARKEFESTELKSRRFDAFGYLEYSP